jgi:uncharacterized protein (DUF2236 family)
MQRAAAPPDFPTARRLNAERLVLFGWSRAILMQLAHPLVAAGVAEHSTVRAGPIATAVRLHHTIHAMLALTFGDAAARERALDGIRTIHRRVHGQLRSAVGRFPAGTSYSAEDPELILWVHATLLDSIPRVYDHLIAPLTIADRDRYCAESADVAIALGANPDAVPRTDATLRQYLAATLASGAIAVGDDARTLAHAVLRPPFPMLTGPGAAVNRLLTIGWLPAELRHQYGFTWNDGDARRRDTAGRWLRRARRMTPPLLALWRDARS